ncbi:MAG: lipopolysaccharide modification acyltransferase [Frankiales bacterium]|nr:lipopolysaccharide modification acyltransferase [Frankiales bacterium]
MVTAPDVLETPLLPRATTPRGRTRRGFLGHSPALDGLRGIALILVLVYHFTGVGGPLPGGWSGVDVFFVLSGFLITALLLDERKLLGRVALARFYARRGLRLLPALLVMLAVWCLLLLAFHNATWFGAVPNGSKSGGTVDVLPALGHVALVLTYGINWVHALFHGHAPLGHLWSLAVEEQFYLVWPFTLLLFLRLPSGRRVWPVLLLAFASAALPFFLYDGGAGKNRIYFGTDTRAVGLLLGAAAALIWHRRRSRGLRARVPAIRAWAGVAFVAGVAVYLANRPEKFVVAPALLGLAVAQVVPYLVDHSTSIMARLLSFKPLAWVGKRSYALYLWHYLWATWTHPLPLHYGMPLGVAGALLCTFLSWRYVEAPALRYAVRFKAPTAVPRQLPVTTNAYRFNPARAVTAVGDTGTSSLAG